MCVLWYVLCVYMYCVCMYCVCICIVCVLCVCVCVWYMCAHACVCLCLYTINFLNTKIIIYNYIPKAYTLNITGTIPSIINDALQLTCELSTQNRTDNTYQWKHINTMGETRLVILIIVLIIIYIVYCDIIMHNIPYCKFIYRVLWKEIVVILFLNLIQFIDNSIFSINTVTQ